MNILGQQTETFPLITRKLKKYNNGDFMLREISKPFEPEVCASSSQSDHANKRRTLPRKTRVRRMNIRYDGRQRGRFQFYEVQLKVSFKYNWRGGRRNSGSEYGQESRKTGQTGACLIW